MTGEPLVYTPAEVAELLQVSESHVRALVRRGLLPAVPHMGRKVRIARVAFEAFVTAGAA